MKIAICSDSHGDRKNIEAMIRRERPEAVLFLGDGIRDFAGADIGENVLAAAVKGNCDFASTYPAFRILTLEGRRILITHGHLFGVKQGAFQLGEKAGEEEADIVFYGHTHRYDIKNIGGRILACPGSISSAGGGTYMVMNLSGQEMTITRKEI